jgi:hypothetical protein
MIGFDTDVVVRYLIIVGGNALLNNNSDRPLFRAAALRLCLTRNRQADALW